MEMASSNQDVIKNIIQFNNEMNNESEHDIWKKLGTFRRWYATHFNNEWLLAPSKYCGYKDMNLKKYIDNYTELDGRDTERQLSKISKEIDSNTYQKLSQLLTDSLQKFGKFPNEKMSIRLIESEEQFRSMNIDSDEMVISSIITMINSLPEKLKNGIKAKL